MGFWEFLDHRWPTEKQYVMTAIFTMGFMMLIMADVNPALWGVELFKTLITVVIVTGCVNMILAFYFTANKSDELRSVNTGKAFDAIKAAQESSPRENDPSAIKAGDPVVLEKQ